MKKRLIQITLFFLIFFFWYGTRHAIDNAVAGLELFSRIDTLNYTSRAILAGSEFLGVGIWMVCGLIAGYIK